MEKEQLRVLVVDDDQGDFEMIRVMLLKAEHQDFRVDWVSSYEEAVDAFDAGGHDVYFVDYFLEDRTGLDVLREARERGIEAPIIMVTGRGGRTVDLEAMGLGASDYLVKGLIDPDILERAVRHALERKEGKRALEERDTWERRAEVPAKPPADTQNAGSYPEPSPSPAAPGDTARFWALFDATGSGVALVSLDGKILKANPPFAGLFAPTSEGAEGSSYLELLEESDREAVAREMEALASGQRTRFEAARRFLTADGSMKWAHTTSILMRNDEGRPDHIMVVTEPTGTEG